MTQNVPIFTDSSEVAELSTVIDFLRWSVSCFMQAKLYYGHGTDNAWDEAVALVLHALYLPHDINPQVMNGRLTSKEKQQIYDLVRLRVEDRIPVPYLTHQAWFMDMPYYVDNRVLIPRSPFAELIAQQFSPWIGEVESILDLCTGSGCIAIACAHVFSHAKVDAVDISADALAVAAKNVAQHQVEEQVSLINSDLFADLENKHYDLIITNPPYVSKKEMHMLPQEYAHEPEMALTAPDDGLAIVITILQKAANYLSKNACLFVEVGSSSKETLSERFPKVPFVWLDLQNGGEGIFMLTKEQLEQHRADFR